MMVTKYFSWSWIHVRKFNLETDTNLGIIRYKILFMELDSR